MSTQESFRCQPAGSGAASPAPLLLVPGVCGTMLGVRPRNALTEGERCWVSLVGADAAYQKLWGKYSPGSGLLELLDPGQEVCIPQGPDSNSGLYPISVLDPTVGFAVRQVHYFEPLITFLQGQGYAPGATLFGGGYDFRQSCRTSAKALLERLQDVSARCNGARVDVVSHSMGGLVMRSLLADFPEQFGNLVGRWVAIGCPFGGAPGYALDALVTGVQFGGSLGDYFKLPFLVERSTFRQGCLQSPALYEMLPPLDFPFAQLPPQLTLWLKEPIPKGPTPISAAASGRPERPAAGAAGEQHSDEPMPCVSHQRFVVHGGPTGASGHHASSMGLSISSAGSSSPSMHRQAGSSSAIRSGNAADAPNSAGSTAFQFAHRYTFQHDHLPGLLARLLKDNAVTVGGKSIPLPFNAELWALGQATHAAWREASLPPGCAFYNLHGTGLSTPYDVQYGSWWYAVQDVNSVPQALASFTFVDGDATVPVDSATAHGLRCAGSAAVVNGGHRDLIALQAVWRQVLLWLQEPLPSGSSRGTVHAAVGAAAAAAGSSRSTNSTALAGGSLSASPQLASGVQHRSGDQLPPGGNGSSSQQLAAAAGQTQEAGEEEFWNPLVWRALLC